MSWTRRFFRSVHLHTILSHTAYLLCYRSSSQRLYPPFLRTIPIILSSLVECTTVTSTRESRNASVHGSSLMTIVRLFNFTMQRNLPLVSFPFVVYLHFPRYCARERIRSGCRNHALSRLRLHLVGHLLTNIVLSADQKPATRCRHSNGPTSFDVGRRSTNAFNSYTCASPSVSTTTISMTLSRPTNYYRQRRCPLRHPHYGTAVYPMHTTRRVISLTHSL